MTGQKASGIKKKNRSTLEVISLLLLTVLVCSITVKAENLKVTRISAGNSHTAVIAADNSLWTFGDNESGELGAGSADDSMIPVRDRKSTRLNSSHPTTSRMPSSA